MCDDWDNMEDDFFEPDNNFEKNLSDEQFDENFENLIDAQDEKQNFIGKEKQWGQINVEDNAFILGSTIAGNAYDETTKKRQLKKNRRNKKIKPLR